MKTFVPYRGPSLEFRSRKRQGSPYSVSLVADQMLVMVAAPSDFSQLLAWLEGAAVELRAFMKEPEDMQQAENLRGDQGGE